MLVVAYNAQDTLAPVLDRIPGDFAARIASVIVCDDASTDATHDVATTYRRGSRLPLTIVRHPHNRGYGGNQKYGYRWAIDRGMDLVVLLHGDGQYAPEELSRMVAPIVDGRADVVFGSRMMRRADALRGGMPLYKFVGNTILTAVQMCSPACGSPSGTRATARTAPPRSQPWTSRPTRTSSTSTPRSSCRFSPRAPEIGRAHV